MEYPSLGGVQEKVSTEVSLGKNRIFLTSLYHMMWFKSLIFQGNLKADLEFVRTVGTGGPVKFFLTV